MIFYFSGTGNSLYTAQQLAQATNDEIISIAACRRSGQYTFTLKPNEQIGFVIPTYFYGIPTIVTEFLELLNLQGYYRNTYSFLVCTMGGSCGSLRYDFMRYLRKIGVNLSASFEVIFPDNYILLFNLLTPADKIPAILEQADTAIAEISASILAKKLRPTRWSLWRYLTTAANYWIYKTGRRTKPFHITDACTRCGKCIKLCPCNTIHMLSNRPVWDKGKCTQCLACLHQCPVHAIQYGKKTYKRGRYVNPHINF